jgi:hypothetical protein
MCRAPIRCLGIAATLFAYFCAVGCNKTPDTVVTGKVTHQDKTLTLGSVVLLGDDNQPIQGPIAPDGTYVIKGVPYGTARVAVFSAEPIKPATAKPNLPPEIKQKFKDNIIEPPPVVVDTSKWFPIPVIYSNPETSGLTIRIEKSETKFDINLP